MTARIISFILIIYAAYFFGLYVQGRVAPWEYNVSGKAFAEYHKAIDFYMGKRMPVMVLSYIGFMILFLIFNRDEWRTFAFWLIPLAIVLQLISIYIGVTSNVRMNPEMNAWNPDHLPVNWQAMRDQWLYYHNRGRFINIPIQVIVFTACYLFWTK